MDITEELKKLKDDIELKSNKYKKQLFKIYEKTEEEKIKEQNFRNYIEKKLLLSHLSDDIYISTMTISCKIDNIEFNCENICRYIDLSYDGIEDIICAIEEGRKHVNEEKNIIYRSLPTKRYDKKEKKKKCVFYNQASMHLKIKTKKTDAVHIKLFSNGAIHITGCQTCNDITETFLSIFSKLKCDKYIIDKKTKEFIEKTFVSDKKYLDISLVSDLKVNMINTNFIIPMKVNLANLYELLLANDKDCRYDKINHSCVNIKYEHPQKIISIFVFEKGSIVITGAKTGEQINSAYLFINKFIYSNYKKLVKRDINVEENITKVLENIK